VRWRAAILGAALVVSARSVLAAAPIAFPIYIEDNHAGSFYWLAENLDLEEPVTLLHFDAHSDASGCIRLGYRAAPTAPRGVETGTHCCIGALAGSRNGPVFQLDRAADAGADHGGDLDFSR
jgi:hypothetical protein